jgi:hypothetical protein
LLTGLTNIEFGYRNSNKGLLKDSPIYDKNLSRKYEVDNIEYDLLLERDDEAKSISIEIETGNKSPAL